MLGSKGSNSTRMGSRTLVIDSHLHMIHLFTTTVMTTARVYFDTIHHFKWEIISTKRPTSLQTFNSCLLVTFLSGLGRFKHKKQMVGGWGVVVMVLVITWQVNQLLKGSHHDERGFMLESMDSP